MTKVDLFSLDNVDDLPVSLKSDLGILRIGSFETRLIELFQKANRRLTLDEVLVGYYRLYNQIKDRKQMTAKLYSMSKSNNPAIRGKRGVYELIKKGVNNG